MIASQMDRPHKRGHLSGDLAHRFEQRKTPLYLQCLIREGPYALVQEKACLLLIRRKMQVGEERLVRLEEFVFDLYGLFYLDDQLSYLVNVFRRRQQTSSG